MRKGIFHAEFLLMILMAASCGEDIFDQLPAGNYNEQSVNVSIMKYHFRRSDFQVIIVADKTACADKLPGFLITCPLFILSKRLKNTS